MKAQFRLLKPVNWLKEQANRTLNWKSFSPLLIPAPEGADNMLIRITHGYFYLIF